MEQGSVLIVAIIEIPFQDKEPGKLTALTEIFEEAFDLLRARSK